MGMCRYLKALGASGDITAANGKGWTPMTYACENAQLSVAMWLVLEGALTLPPSGRVERTVVRRNVARTPTNHRDIRPALYSWAMRVFAVHHAFRHSFLLGTLEGKSAHLWKLGYLSEEGGAVFKTRVAEFVGVECDGARALCAELSKAHGRYLRPVEKGQGPERQLRQTG